MAHFVTVGGTAEDKPTAVLINADLLEYASLETAEDPITDEQQGYRILLKFSRDRLTLSFNSLEAATGIFSKLLVELNLGAALAPEEPDEPEVPTDTFEYECLQCHGSYADDVPIDQESKRAPCPNCGKTNEPLEE